MRTYAAAANEHDECFLVDALLGVGQRKCALDWFPGSSSTNFFRAGDVPDPFPFSSRTHPDKAGAGGQLQGSSKAFRRQGSSISEVELRARACARLRISVSFPMAGGNIQVTKLKYKSLVPPVPPQSALLSS